MASPWQQAQVGSRLPGPGGVLVRRGSPNPEENAAALGEIETWAKEHNTLKQRGFYVDVDAAHGVLTPDGVGEEESLQQVISHVHQIGWQLRLGAHIIAKGQEQTARWTEGSENYLGLHNDAYRFRLPEPASNPFANLGRPGYEAETRELLRLDQEAQASYEQGDAGTAQ
jgi:hypothetical protein